MIELIALIFLLPTQTTALTFVMFIESVASVWKAALPLSLFRTQYPRAELFFISNGPNTTQVAKLAWLCKTISHCTFLHNDRDLFHFAHKNARYVSINGKRGFADLFALYRKVSSASHSEVMVLLQPDCMVRGQIPALSVLDLMRDKAAGVASHINTVNPFNKNLKLVIQKENAFAKPDFFGFTCGSMWKASIAHKVFSPHHEGIVHRAGCEFDDVCISAAFLIANYTIRKSFHSADIEQAESKYAALIHGAKNHYRDAPTRIPLGSCPYYDRLREKIAKINEH